MTIQHHWEDKWTNPEVSLMIVTKDGDPVDEDAHHLFGSYEDAVEWAVANGAIRSTECDTQLGFQFWDAATFDEATKLFDICGWDCDYETECELNLDEGETE